MTDAARENLGRFVVLQTNEDGSQSATFSVPEALRPEGWPQAIYLPEFGAQAGHLNDSRFQDAIVADAVRLNERLEIRRAQASAMNSVDRDLPRLVEIYLSRDTFTNLAPESQAKIRRYCAIIVKWSAARGHPRVDGISELDVDDCLSSFRNEDAKRISIRSLWSMLFRTAIYAKWIDVHPMRKGGWKRKPARKLRVWTDRDVENYADQALKQGQPSIAALIQVMSFTGQRQGDLRNARWGKEYNGQRLVIVQSKTKAPVNIPLPKHLQDLLVQIQSDTSPFVFPDHNRGGREWTAGALRGRFTQLRRELILPGEHVLCLKELRHSCIHRMFAAGSSLVEIAGVTGHKLKQICEILERYSPDREGAAERGVKKMHIASGGSLDDFANIGHTPIQDWIGAEGSERRFYVVAAKAPVGEFPAGDDWYLTMLSNARREREERILQNRE